MPIFQKKYEQFFQQSGSHKKMVLSTSLHDRVTSRMMSVIVMEERFYFQTDITLRKYEQLRKNPNVSLCADNMQIEGTCQELGHPTVSPEFCRLYQQNFPGSYEKYTHLENERLFCVTPSYIQKWIYENGEPYMEAFDCVKARYEKIPYLGQ